MLGDHLLGLGVEVGSGIRPVESFIEDRRDAKDVFVSKTGVFVGARVPEPLHSQKQIASPCPIHITLLPCRDAVIECAECPLRRRSRLALVRHEQLDRAAQRGGG